jgi:hypothetical protein
MFIVTKRFRHVVAHKFGACDVDDNATSVSLLKVSVFEALFQAQKGLLVELNCKFQLVMLAKSIA